MTGYTAVVTHTIKNMTKEFGPYSNYAMAYLVGRDIQKDKDYFTFDVIDAETGEVLGMY